MTVNSIQRRLAMAGALLFFIGMLTGLWSAAALTGLVKVGIPHLALAAHLNGILGGLWMIAVAWTFNFLHYGLKGQRWLTFGVGLAAWSNWLVTLAASFLGVTGLMYSGNHANDVIAVLLQTLVVIPSLVACGFWVWGFRELKDVSRKGAESPRESSNFLPN